MPQESAQGRVRAFLKRWALRAALAVGAPAALLLALEGALRLAGQGRPTTFLIADARPDWFRTNPEFASRFLPGNFDLRPLNFRISRHKAPGTVRIVVLGESAAQGVPVPSFAFAPQLRAQLRHVFPRKDFEVVDTGIVAINSHVVYQIAREMAGFEPDLFVVYMGNNEVVGPYGPGCVYLSRMPPLWMIRASVYVRSTRTGQIVGSLVSRLSSPFGRRPAEWGGMSMFVDNAVTGDDPRLAAVYDNFAANLRGIVDEASGAHAKTILCTVVANLKDCPPFLSRHRPGMSQPELASWQAAFGQGRLAWMLRDDANARAQLTVALRIDPQFADTQFMLGSLDLRSGDTPSARARFLKALHWDALRFRPDARINQIIREVAQEEPHDVSLLDAAVAMGSDGASSAPISGREILFEHVHFDWPGNSQLARLLAQRIAATVFGLDRGESGWLDDAACAEALAYTPHERLPMLLRVDALLRKPPFTNQLTHVGDEARMAREIDAATQAMAKPSTLRRASATAKAALAADPDNLALEGVLEGIDLDLGELDGALAVARRAGELLPGDFSLAADEASVLVRLGRFTDAEKLLKRAAGSGADLDMLIPALANLWTRAKRTGDGIRFLDDAIANRPRDLRLRLARAGLLRESGDPASAEREFRAVLDKDPANEEALEALVGILVGEGKRDEVARESVARAGSQPGNQANSVRAANDCEARGDLDGMVRNLESAELSGPVNTAFELTLALKLYGLKRMDGVMTHLAEARSLSDYEGDPAVTESIVKLIARMQREMGRGPAAH